MRQYTVRTVAADLRRGEHIPKMQNNIGRKSMLRVLATPRGARPGAAFSTSAVNLRQIEFGEFGSGSANNTRMGSIQVSSGLYSVTLPTAPHLPYTYTQ